MEALTQRAAQRAHRVERFQDDQVERAVQDIGISQRPCVGSLHLSTGKASTRRVETFLIANAKPTERYRRTVLNASSVELNAS